MSGSKANICGLKARFKIEASLVGRWAGGSDDERWMVLMGLWWWWWWSWWSWWGCARHLAPRASSDHPPHRRTLSQSYWTRLSGLLCQCCPIDQTHWTYPGDSALMQSSDWIIVSLSRKIGGLISYTPPQLTLADTASFKKMNFFFEWIFWILKRWIIFLNEYSGF